MKNRLRRLIASFMLFAAVLFITGACASAKYGQVPCPCENNGGR